MAGDLERLHARIDSMVCEMSNVSQRVARIEVQEARIAENAKDIDRLEDRMSQVDVVLAHRKRGDSVQPKSRAIEYAGKGALIFLGGIVAELVRVLIKMLNK